MNFDHHNGRAHAVAFVLAAWTLFLAGAVTGVIAAGVVAPVRCRQSCTISTPAH